MSKIVPVNKIADSTEIYENEAIKSASFSSPHKDHLQMAKTIPEVPTRQLNTLEEQNGRATVLTKTAEKANHGILEDRL